MLNIVLPVAGRGSRFVSAGFAVPKPMIPVHGIPMLQWVIANLRPRTPHRFIFLALREHLESGFRALLDQLAPDSIIVTVDTVTEGAACTVLLARAFIDSSDPLMIANTDQYVDLAIDDYLDAFDASGLDGFIMTFTANDPKWSYARLASDGRVTEVVEKKVVSRDATVGIYNYRRGSDFVHAADEMIAKNLRVNGEFYVAPAYNQLIERGAKVGVFNIDNLGTGMHGLGTPEDLDAFLANDASRTFARRVSG
ncbi:MAG TPA: glycosyltransferase family 2 protein [Thermoanaerobaculia bacterium]|nr:glycosyltransferase family 2 protein [Thermoanaerobaculia bacterium]